MNGIKQIRTSLSGWTLALGGRMKERLPLRRGLAALESLGAAFLLAGLPFFGSPLPLGAGLSLCLGLWAPALAAALGATGGYLLLWGWEAALEPVALTWSFLAGAVIFRHTPVSKSMLSAVLTGAVGAVFLLDAGFGPGPLAHLAAGTALAALLPQVWDRAAVRGQPEARLGAGAALLLGLCAVAPPIGPALALLGTLLLPLLPGLSGLDGGGGTPEDRPSVRALPARRGVEQALETMYRTLAREDPVLPPLQLSEVYDFAAGAVCRCCVCGAQCWEENAEDTYRDLVQAGEAILHRGTALREDFPQRFLGRCHHAGGFVTAVNQALDETLSRRREDHRRLESRRIAAGQYRAMADLLGALTRPRPSRVPAYAPDLAVGSVPRTGNRVSGDRGAACRDRFGNFYVLLCDGMGSGPEARAESDRTARLLTAFLEAGMEADGALNLVNGFCLLRKTSAFATVDLVRLDLATGRGTLYKWGAAPSYLRRGAEVEKIGTATPPPGTAPAEGRAPEQYELSLRDGETLVMVSDGAYGEETARRLADFAQGTVRDLASCLIALGEGDGADDRTALVLRLRRLEQTAERPREGARRGSLGTRAS